MFFGSIKHKIEISELKIQLNDALQQAENLRHQLETLKVREVTANATPSVDFSKIRCFSVERNAANGYPHTILGYNLPTDAENTNPREWSIYCSAEHHEKLVEEFNKQKKGK